MFQKSSNEISYYPTDLFLSEHTHNSFTDLDKLPWEFKEEMRVFLEEKFKLIEKKTKKDENK